jgi:hypothetical protein
MFGLGGTFVEVIQDVSFRLLPLRRRDAQQMITETRPAELDGYRGLALCRPTCWSAVVGHRWQWTSSSVGSVGSQRRGFGRLVSSVGQTSFDGWLPIPVGRSRVVFIIAGQDRHSVMGQFRVSVAGSTPSILAARRSWGCGLTPRSPPCPNPSTWLW